MGVISAAEQSHNPLVIQVVSSGDAHAGMFGFFFNKGPVNNFEDAKQSDTAKFGRFHRGMLEHGIYLAPSAYEVTTPA